MFKIGDYVRVERVSKQDKLHSRFVGEIGVFQGYDEEGYAQVCVQAARTEVRSMSSRSWV